MLLFILLSGYHPFDPANNADDEEVGRRISNVRLIMCLFCLPSFFLAPPYPNLLTLSLTCHILASYPHQLYPARLRPSSLTLSFPL